MFLSYSILTKVLEGKFTRGCETGEALVWALKKEKYDKKI